MEIGLQAQGGTENGKAADSKSSSHPIVQPVAIASEALQFFDEITYLKGSAVIKMLESYVGPEPFRRGIRKYLVAHAYGNAVDADLWREIQTSARKPVLDIEHDFTTQPGVPLFRVEQIRGLDGGTAAQIRQDQYLENPASGNAGLPRQWRIPILVSAGGHVRDYLLSAASPVVVPLAGDVPLLVNAGQSTFARTLYAPSIFRALARSAGQLKTTDQLGLLYDAWALGRSSYQPLTDYLELARSIPVQADPLVWVQIIDKLVAIDRLYSDLPSRAGFAAFAASLLRPVADRVGWDPDRNEDSNVPFLRSNVFPALARFGDSSVIAEAHRRFESALKNPGSISTDSRLTATWIVARTADGNMLDRLIAMVREAHDPTEKRNLITALVVIADPASAARAAEIVSGPDTPPSVAPNAVRILSINNPELAWKSALQHVGRPDFVLLGPWQWRLMSEIAANSRNPERIAELKAYADQHPDTAPARQVDAAVSSIELNVKMRAERLPEIDRWLAANTR